MVRGYHFFKKRSFDEKKRYLSWIQRSECSDSGLKLQSPEAKRLSIKPLFSIVTATFNVSPEIFKKTFDSVTSQTYGNWEWCLVDGSDNADIKKFVKGLSGCDKRIKFKSLENNFGIARNLNEACDMVKGDYFVFLDHDDLLRPFSLFEVATSLNKKAADFIYSDEDKVAADEECFDPFFKPDWSPHLLTSFNYINHLTVISSDLFKKVGGLRAGFDGAQDYDLYLRSTRQAKNILHIPKVLYSWRKTKGSTAAGFFEKSYAQASGKKALESYLKENKIHGSIEETPYPGIYRLRRKLLKEPAVSIIIPTQDKKDYLEKCIDSILRSSYRNFEIVIVNHQSKETETLNYLKLLSKNPKIRVLNFEGPFNYSAINNFAVSETKASYLLFLNNDTQVLNSDWLESMLEIMQDEKVGVVAPKLLFPNGTVQNFGVVVGLGGIAGSVLQGCPKEHPGYWGNLVSIRDVSAVSAAAMLVKRETFEQVGGFDENLKIAFNDIDLCLKVREKGFYIVVTPYAEAYHCESVTRGHEYSGERLKIFKQEISYFAKKWKKVLEAGDPFYNRNLSLVYPDYRIKDE